MTFGGGMKQVIGLLALLLLLSACGGRQSGETVTVNPFSIEREAQLQHGDDERSDMQMDGDAHGGADEAEMSEHTQADDHAEGHAEDHGHASTEVANEFWNRETSYTLPDPTPAPQAPTLSYGGGDSSSGRVIHGISGNSLSFNAATPSEVEAAPQAQVAPPADSQTDAAQDQAADADAAPEAEADVEADAAEAGAETADDAEMTDSATEMADEEMTEAAEPQAPVADFDWQQLGETTYVQNCSACHQANGQGIPGAFPPLAGHIPNLYNAEGGREYLIKVVLYGLQGQIVVDGMTYNGAMNPWGQLSNEQIAAALNHELTSWGNDQLLTNFTPIMPDEVEALRGLGLAPTQVLEARPNIGN
jgi:mono/diheme cytochrome c family protein